MRFADAISPGFLALALAWVWVWVWSGLSGTVHSIRECSKLVYSAVVRVSFQLVSFFFSQISPSPARRGGQWWNIIYRIFKIPIPILIATSLVSSGTSTSELSFSTSFGL